MKMHFVTKLIAAAATAAVLLSTLTGCSGSIHINPTAPASTGKAAVAYCVGATANSKAIDYSSVPVLQNSLLTSAESYGHSFIIRNDGQPELVDSTDFDIPEQQKKASKERLQRDAQAKAAAVSATMASISAVNPEVDYLEAIRVAASCLRSLDDTYTSRTIYICGSGLSTTGYINYQHNILSCPDPAIIVSQLQEQQALPDLSGMEVVYIGLGQTQAPQEKLTPKQVATLTSIWQSVIESCGASFESNEYISVSTDLNSVELPPVSTVAVPADAPITFDAASTDYSQPVAFTEETVAFIADSAEYLDRTAAEQTLQPVAQYLNQNPSAAFLLVGCTAGEVTDNETLTLSKNRANAVKDTLVQFGVSESRLTTVGLGSSDPWHVVGADAANRKVVLLDAGSELAQQLT